MPISRKDFLTNDNKFRKVDKYLYVRNGRIYAIKAHKGKTYKQATPMQDSLAINDQCKPTKELKAWLANWVSRINNKDYIDTLGPKSKVPTIGEYLAAYKKIAEVEYQVSGRPRPASAHRATINFLRLVRDLGLSEKDHLDKLTGRACEEWIYRVVGDNEIRAVSAYATVGTAMTTAAAWARRRYENDYKWTIPSWSDMPKARGAALGVQSYQRPDDSLRQRTIAWWNSIETLQPQVWLAVTMMLQFAMRNGDVAALTWKNFHKINGTWTLVYTPSKTRVSARGRSVTWPMTDKMYERIRAAASEASTNGGTLIEESRSIFSSINAQMRGLGWVGTKGAYELRKMCVDQVYRTMGLERAIQVSGDDSKTLQRFYADPSRASFQPVEDLF